VAIVNEADRMTDQAEAMWLDGLEHLPSHSVVVFTTNNVHRLSDRFRRRCECHEFDGSSDDFRSAMEGFVRWVVFAETGKKPQQLPEGLGKFEQADDAYSIGLALQQLAPYIRNREPLPDRLAVPMIRGASPEAPKVRKRSHEAWDDCRPPETYRQSKPQPEASKPAPTAVPEAVPAASTATPARYKVLCQACRKWIARGEPARPHHHCTSKTRWQHAACA
jgi:hypothetical protein